MDDIMQFGSHTMPGANQNVYFRAYSMWFPKSIFTTITTTATTTGENQ